MRPRRLEVALFAIALAVAGLVALTLVVSGPGTYEEIARDGGRETVTFRGPGPRTATVDLATLVALHEEWVAYLTGRRAEQPRSEAAVLTADEQAHMADVRGVFLAAQAAGVLGALGLAWLVLRARRQRAVARLVRAGAIAAVAGVGLVAVLAAVAFDAAFLLFHRIFFPQGNFLFPPGSHLLTLYPEAYFYGVTLRIGAAFVAVALALAGVAHASLRFRRDAA